LSDDVKQEHLRMVPMQRFGTVDYVVYAVLALCSPSASYIHGMTLEVDGGSERPSSWTALRSRP
jgi:3-oxoacyl-[acyl-carrier protein] reductase